MVQTILQRDDDGYIGAFKDSTGNTVQPQLTAAGKIPVDGTFTLSEPDTPAIYNVSVILANTEYSQVLPADTRKFSIKCRTNSLLKLSYTVGESGTKYITVPSNSCKSEDNLKGTITLYFQSIDAGVVAEIEAWN